MTGVQKVVFVMGKMLFLLSAMSHGQFAPISDQLCELYVYKSSVG